MTLLSFDGFEWTQTDRFQALIHSNSAREGALEDHRLVKMSTYGIIFMGTPHQGSSAASMGQAFVNIASIFSPTNSRVIRNLQRDSELLQQQLQQFNVISQEFVTKFAYEEYSTPVAKGTSVLVSLGKKTEILENALKST